MGSFHASQASVGGGKTEKAGRIRQATRYNARRRSGPECTPKCSPYKAQYVRCTCFDNGGKLEVRLQTGPSPLFQF